MARKQGSRARRRGQVLVVSIVALLVMAVVAALAVDVGRLCAVRARLQSAADAAALAAAQRLLEARFDGSDEATARAAAAAEAERIVGLNAEGARAEVAFGDYEEGQFVPRSAEAAAMAVHVVVGRDADAPAGPLRLLFGGLVGRETQAMRVEAISRAATGVGTIRGGLRPFAIPASVLEGVELGETFVFQLPHGPWQELWDGDELSPGNFGLLNLGGGALSTSELACYILHGYPGELSIDPQTGCVWIEGQCGVRASVQGEVESLVGEPVLVCVYDQVEGQGANARFRVVWFASVTILEVQLSGTDKYIRMQLDRLTPVPDCELGGPPSNVCKVQLVE